jgi:hypothetical protein
MPDISMCLTDKCTQRNECFRYRAKPSEYRQAYMAFKQEDGKCDDFTHINKWTGYIIREIKDE